MPHSSTDSKYDGLVVAAHGQRGVLETREGRLLNFMLKGRTLKAVCGDFVAWVPGEENDSAVVTECAPRRNQLARPDSRGRSEVLAANLDVLFVVLASEPKPDWYVADRFVCAAELMGVTTVICWNKCDLEAETAPEIENYVALGYTVLQLSAQTGVNIDRIAAQLGSRTGMLVGQSGVGKSSLINRLIGTESVQTAEVSQATGEGRHTTTASRMHTLVTGGRLINSPGVREFAPFLDDPTRVQDGFIEIARARHGCRFANCQHVREPGCAVKAAVDAGQITAHRYESYKRLRANTEDLTRKSR